MSEQLTGEQILNDNSQFPYETITSGATGAPLLRVSTAKWGNGKEGGVGVKIELNGVTVHDPTPEKFRNAE